MNDNLLPLIRSITAPVKQITANQEVILSAGTIGSIILLQLSGIGDKSELSALGIKTIVDSPSVGKNLSDHVLQPNIFSVNTSATYDDIFRGSPELATDLQRWNQTRTGPLAGGLANHVGWLRLPDNSSIFKTVKDPSAGPHASHFELIVSVSVYQLKQVVNTQSLFRIHGSTLALLFRSQVILPPLQPH